MLIILSRPGRMAGHRRGWYEMSAKALKRPAWRRRRQAPRNAMAILREARAASCVGFVAVLRNK